jgi:hypothetical protein
MKRTLALVLVVVAVAAGVIVASVTVSSNAAVVNGSAITRQDLNTDLQTIADSADYQCFLRAQALSEGAQYFPPVAGAGAGSSARDTAASGYSPTTYSSVFAGYWLNQMVNAKALAQLNERKGFEVTSFDLTHARLGVERSMDQALAGVAQSQYACPTTSGAAVLDSLPKSFVNELVEHQANQYAFVLSSAGTVLSPLSVARYYRAHHADFRNVCVVALPLSSAAEAQQVTSAVQAGTPFATIAQQAGGSSACGVAALSQYLQAAAKLQPGQITTPLTYGQGYLLLQLTSIHPTKMSAETDDVIRVMFSRASSSASSKLVKGENGSHVEVDPRYGHWVAAPSFTISPPASPPLSSLLCGPANDPSVAVAVCPPKLVTGSSSVTGAGAG